MGTGVNFGVKSGNDAMEKTWACHISNEREEVNYSGVSDQISTVLAMYEKSYF